MLRSPHCGAEKDGCTDCQAPSDGCSGLVPRPCVSALNSTHNRGDCQMCVWINCHVFVIVCALKCNLPYNGCHWNVPSFCFDGKESSQKSSTMILK